jgi:hypothetical protein
MRLSTAYLRSVQGQLVLLAITLAGGILLAVAALCLRSVLFEPHIREKYPELSRKLEADLKKRDRAAGDRVRKLSPRELRAVYGAWISAPDLDPRGWLADHLLALHGPALLGNIRQTLVVGNAEQRGRALALLGRVSAEDLKPEARRLGRYALDRSRRRREPELARQAEAVLDKLRPEG